MRKLYKLALLSMLAILSCQLSFGQASENYKGGLKLKLAEDGSRYVRFITWHQMWSTTTLGENSSTDFRLRRSRFLAFAKISKRFLIVTHFGLNNLTRGQMGTAGPVPSGSGNGSFFMHDAWVDFTVIPGVLNIGGGLHYWNGISRMNNQSTLNFLTLDNAGHNWATIGTSDQFARHLGFFAKGKLGRLDYRISVNEAIANPLLGGSFASIQPSSDTTGFVTDKAVYRDPNGGAAERGSSGKVFSGYLNYQFKDKEGNTLPYMVGTYLGKKTVFNVGAGFFYHQNGSFYYSDANGTVEQVSPVSFAADVFVDMPVGENGGAFTGYASFTSHAWGPNLTGGLDGVGTGNLVYAHAGYLIPGTKIQPYIHTSLRDLEAHDGLEASTSNRFGIGANYYVEGNNAKVSLEYQRSAGTAAAGVDRPVSSNLRLQLMIYL